MFAQAISAATTTGKEIIRFLFLSTQTVEPSLPFWKDQVSLMVYHRLDLPRSLQSLLMGRWWGGGGGGDERGLTSRTAVDSQARVFHYLRVIT